MTSLYRGVIVQLQKVDGFLAWAAKHPLWCLGGAAFATIFWLLVSFVSSLPERMTEIFQNSHRFEMYEREGEKVSLLFTALKESVAAYVAASEFYSSKVGGHTTVQPIPTAILLEGAKEAAVAREKVALATGALQGTRFEDARLQAYRSPFEDDLTQLGRMVTYIEDFFILQLAGETRKSIETISNLNAVAIKQHVAAMIARSTQFTDLAVHITREQTIEVSSQTAKFAQFRWKFWIACLGVLYELTFVFAAIWSIWFGHSSINTASSRHRS